MEDRRIKCTLYALEHTSTKSYVDSKGTLYCKNDDNFDECVFMHSSMFEKLFGEKWKNTTNTDLKYLPVVKISYNGNSIFRRYRCVSAARLCKDQIALNKRSLALLCPTEDLVNKTVDISKGEERDFFKNHPDHETRMVYKMSEEAIALSKITKTLSEEAVKMNEKATRISKLSWYISILSVILAIISLFR